MSNQPFESEFGGRRPASQEMGAGSASFTVRSRPLKIIETFPGLRGLESVDAVTSLLDLLSGRGPAREEDLMAFKPNGLLAHRGMTGVPGMQWVTRAEPVRHLFMFAQNR